MTILDAMDQSVWALPEPNLQVICDIVNRHVAVHLGLAEPLDIAAIRLESGKSIGDQPQMQVEAGVAILPLRGVISPRANLMTEHSGATSLESLSADVHAALGNDDVRSILFRVDSPGGNVVGVSDFAHLVRQARHIKPVVAYVDDMCCSAALWAMSGVDRIFVSPTARLGSVGVMTVIEDEEPIEGQKMPRRLIIKSPHAPNKGASPTSKVGRAELQANVAAIEEVMLKDIAQGRGIPTSQVIGKFGGGGTVIGKYAVAAGMGDAVSYYDDVLRLMQEAAKRNR